MAVKKKTMIKSNVAKNRFEAAIVALSTTCEEGNKAVDARAKQGKKNAALVARLSKKRTALLKRKKTAAIRLKKDSSADNHKALSIVTKDINAVAKDLKKAKSGKDANNLELSGLRATLKSANAYMKAISVADKILNKPKKKKRRAKKKASKLVSNEPSPV